MGGGGGGHFRNFWVGMCCWNPGTLSLYQSYEGVVSKETMVLRRWGSSIQKFGFINGVDNVNWPPYRDSTT